jgi:hypothetical protein
MIPYRYDWWGIEATNYFMENYDMKLLGRYVLLKRGKDGSREEIGHWEGASLVMSMTPELSEKEKIGLDRVCEATTKRIGNDLNGADL